MAEENETAHVRKRALLRHVKDVVRGYDEDLLGGHEKGSNTTKKFRELFEFLRGEKCFFLE